MITQVEIAKMLKLDVSTVNKILNRKPGTKFRPETVSKVQAVAKKHGYDFSRLKFIHRRRHDRKPTNLKARIVLKLPDGTVFDEGMARLGDLSIGGARMTDLELPRKLLPTQPFTLFIEIEGLRLQATPIRFIWDGEPDLAVSFTGLDEPTRRKLKKLL
jgi:hypothetical protein